jgi:RHS repeat-associated protein
MALFFSGGLMDVYATVQPSSTSTVFYSVDHLGSTRVVTDGSGIEQARYSYYPYGELLIPPNPPLKKGGMGGFSPYLYTSQQHDLESNLYYYSARYYDAALARFVSMDPILQALPQTLSVYSYSFNNPIVYLDPSGKQGERFDWRKEYLLSVDTFEVLEAMELKLGRPLTKEEVDHWVSIYSVEPGLEESDPIGDMIEGLFGPEVQPFVLIIGMAAFKNFDAFKIWGDDLIERVIKFKETKTVMLKKVNEWKKELMGVRSQLKKLKDEESNLASALKKWESPEQAQWDRSEETEALGKELGRLKGEIGELSSQGSELDRNIDRSLSEIDTQEKQLEMEFRDLMTR